MQDYVHMQCKQARKKIEVVAAIIFEVSDMLAIPYNKRGIHSLGGKCFFNVNKNAETSYWL